MLCTRSMMAWATFNTISRLQRTHYGSRFQRDVRKAFSSISSIWSSRQTRSEHSKTIPDLQRTYCDP